MKKHILSSLKRILCIGLALNIIYTSVDFSALNVWAEEEVIESTENEEPDTEISGDTEENTDVSKDVNPEGDNEVGEEKSFLERLGNLLPFSLAPLNDNDEEEPEQYDPLHGHVLLEGYSFDATISLGEGFRNVNYDDLDGILRGLDENDNPDLTKERVIKGAYVYFYSSIVKSNCDIIITSNNTAIIKDIPVYIKEGTGDPQKTGGTGEYKTDPSSYEIRLSTDPLDENNMYTAHFAGTNSNGSRYSYLDLKLADNDLQWTVTAKNTLNVVRRDVKDIGFDVKIYDGEGVSNQQALDKFIDKRDIGYSFTEDGITRFISNNEVEYVDDVTGRVTLRNIPKDFAASNNYTVRIPNKKGYKTYIVRGSEITALEEYQGDWDYELKTIDGGFDSVLYIKDDILTGTIRFMDGNKSAIRPDIDTIQNLINVYDANTNALIEKDKYTLSITQAEDGSNRWDISITGLPMYTTDGRILHYCYKIDADNNTIPSKGGAENYRIQYSNGTSNADASRAYSGATIYLSINKANPAYTFNVTWKDDQYNNTDNSARTKAGEGINFYLWRSVESQTDAGMEISSPVSDSNGNQYRIPLKEIEGYTDDTFTVNVSEKFPSLPVYNENGYEYTYYLTTLNQTNHSDGYIDSYGQSEANQNSTHIYNGTDVILTRVGVGNINANVVWKAEGEKDYIGTKSVLRLQRRIKTETGVKGAWEDIPSAVQKEDGTSESSSYTEITTGAASDKKTEVEATFYEVQKFDNNGQTYEYRVLEHAFSTEKSFTTIGETWAPDDNDADTYTTSAKYKLHDYQITTEYDDEKDRYIITNKLHQDIVYTIDIRWRENVPNGITVDEYREILKNRLKDTEHPVTYTMQRNGVNYVTLTVSDVTEDGKVKYAIDYLNDDMKDSTGTVEIGRVDESNSVRWLFKVPLAKYDDEGRKYTYTIEGEDDNNTHYGTEHKLILDAVDEKISPEHAGMFIDKDYNSAANQVVISHSLAHLGYPYTITVKATWDDNITDYSKRMVDVHILALTKKDSNYYLYKDLHEEGGVQLNSSNEFTRVIYYTPFKLESALSNDISDDGILYYTAVEYAISYDQTDDTHTAKLPIYEELNDGRKKLREIFIVAGDETVQTEFKYDSGNLLDVYVYSYEVNTTTPVASTDRMFNWDATTEDRSRRSHTKIFHNKLVDIKGDITVDINWVDDHNSSDYRKNAYQVELVATVAGREDKTLSKFSDALNWNEYKSRCTKDGVLNNSEYDNVRLKFEDIPQFDNDGNPIVYSIRQWIVDENGNKSLIDPTATERTTKNNYIITATSETPSATFKDDVYSIHNNFTVRNTGSNINYETKFYVLWHDQAAYQANSRSDMTYELYYKLDNSSDYIPYDMSTYNSIVEAVKEGLLFENPYYQTVNYYGLREFTHPDADGNAYKIHYYLVEEKTDATEGYYDYAIEYYGNDHEDLEKSTSGTIFSHRHYDFKDNVTANKIGKITYPNGVKMAEDTCYLPENCVVRNYIVEDLEVRGTKQWLNMTSRDEKPECDIYLFRVSDYETDMDHDGTKLDSTPAANSYVDKTTLYDDKSGYVFTKKDNSEEAEKYPKFDRYGAAYTYKIAEYIKSTDGRPISTEIMGATSDGSSMLINTFDPLQKNNRSITIRKEWQDVDTKKNLPFAKFLVYRMECNYQIEVDGKNVNPTAEGVEFNKVKAAIDSATGDPVKYDEYLKENAQLIASQYIQFNKDNTDDGAEEIILTNLRNYAPNGIPYVYFVVEDTSFVPSYTVTNLASDTLSENNGYGYKLADNVSMCAPVGSTTATTSLLDGLKGLFGLNDQDNQAVGFRNARNIAEKFITITGTIKWDEGSTAIGKTARPSRDDANKNIRLKITRTSSTQKGEENQISNETVNIGGATDGFVPGDSIYWEEGASNNIWKYTIKLKQEEQQEEFLKYASNGNVYVYKVQETFLPDDVKIADNYTAVLGSVSKVSTAAENGILNVGQMSNALRGEFAVRKHWIDGYNSYGLRPQKILVMYQYKEKDGSSWIPLRYSSELTDDKAGKIIVREIAGSKWENSITKFPFFTADGMQYTYRAVEIGIGYTSEGDTKWVATTDIDLNDYETGSGFLNKNDAPWDYSNSGPYEYKGITSSSDDSQSASVVYPFASNGTFGSYRVIVQLDDNSKPQDGIAFSKSNLASTVTVTNILDQKNYVVITKIWDDNDNAFGVRPANITYKIQKRVIENKKKDNPDLDINSARGEAKSDWTDVGTVVLSAANEKAKGSNTWTKKFDNFPGFDENEDFLEYRALEMGVAESYYKDSTPEVETAKPELINIIPENSIDKSADKDKIEGTANNSTTVVGGAYNLTDYKYTNNSTYFSVETTNTLKHESKTVKVNKDWLIKNDSASGDTLAAANGYSAKVRLSVPYGSGENSKTVTSTIDLASGNYEHTWNEIPSYIIADDGITKLTLNYDGITITEQSVKLGSGEGAASLPVTYEEDDPAYGTYTDADGNQWITRIITGADDSGNRIFTITNTPLTKHGIEVSYDTESDSNNAYNTRPESAVYKLQYRVKGSTATAWNDIAESSEIAKSLKGVNYSNIAVSGTPAMEAEEDAGTDAAEATGTLADTYTAEIDKLPKYLKTDDGIGEYEYRILEIKAGSLDVTYDNVAALTSGEPLLAVSKHDSAADDNYGSDRSVGGYTYEYNDQDKTGDKQNIDTTTYLKKTLLTIELKGEKVWEDQNNIYSTRPAMDTSQETQTDTSKVQVKAYKAGDELSGLEVMWKTATDGDNKDNIWIYYTNDSKLPKYQSNSNNLENYTVAESVVPTGYVTDHGSAAKVGLDKSSGINNGDAVKYPIEAITNSLEKKSITVNKTWGDKDIYDSLGIEPVSTTYTLQVSTDEGKNYANLLQGSGTSKAPAIITVPYNTMETEESPVNNVFSDVPVMDNAGNSYTYRVIESGIEFKLNDSIPVTHTVKYNMALSDDKTAFTGAVNCRVDGGTATAVNTVAYSGLSGTGISYALGLFNVQITKTADAETYNVTNTPKTASASVTVNWKEVAGSNNNDAKLIQNFRPAKLTLMLQRRIGDSGVWSDVPAGTDSSTKYEETITQTEHTFSYSADDLNANKLPLYIVADGAVKTYEYRIVEKTFDYGTAGYRELSYNIESNGKTIYSDFSGTDAVKTLECSDHQESGDQKKFYVGTQSNNVTDYDYHTTIDNELRSNTLVEQVLVTLSGQIEWKDGSDILGKRPNETGVTMLLRAQIPGVSGATTLPEVEFVIGKSGDETAAGTGIEIDTNISDGKDGTSSAKAKLTWTKDASTDTWTYSIEDLPLYDKNGHYITYSVAHKDKNVTADYVGTAKPAEGTTDSDGHKSDTEHKYAFGKVTDNINKYDQTTDKKIELVDFVENMNTTFTIVKTWDDQINAWESRTANWYLYLERREVEVDDAKVITTADDSGWQQALGAGTTFDKTKVESGDGLGNYILVSTADGAEHKAAMSGDNNKVWTYAMTMPQFDENGKLLQYRATEIGRVPTNTGVPGDYVLIESKAEPDTNDGYKNVYHVGSYYMTEYDYSEWNVGYSTTRITNKLDEAVDITVSKAWNTPDDYADKPDEVTIELVGKIRSNNSVDNDVSTVLTVFQKKLGKDNQWKYTYENLPKYDLQFREIEWSVKEIKIGDKDVNQTTLLSDKDAGVSVDGRWLATYTKNTVDSTGDENTKIDFTITNTPAINAKLVVDYQDDLENKYSTRPETGKAVLQYRPKATGATWSNIPENLANNIIRAEDDASRSLKDSNGISITTNTSASDSYSYVLTNLPIYDIKSDGTKTDTYIEYEYRIVEIQQGDSLVVSYTDASVKDNTDLSLVPLTATHTGDEASGGYTYAYSLADASDKQADSKLAKTLITTTLEGRKLWKDESNAYQTRANAANGTLDGGEYKQTDASNVKVTVGQQGKTSIPQPDIWWNTSANGEQANIWTYRTGNLPKYAALTDTLASYNVVEAYGNKQYIITYGNGTPNQADITSTKYAIENATSGAIIHTLADINNTLHSVNMVAQKKWLNDNDNKFVGDVIFKLQRKVENASDSESNPIEYTDVPDSYKTKTITKAAGDEKVAQNTPASVEWHGLPACDESGNKITYQIVETSTFDNYALETETNTDTATKTTTTTFYNIQLQDYTVNKTWEDTVSDLMDLNGSYSSTFELLQSTDNGQSWVNVTVDDNKVEDTLTVTYEETKINKGLRSKTYQKLPRFTKTGEIILYKAAETKINEVALSDSTKPMVKSYAVTYSYTKTDDENYSVATSINNKLKEVPVVIMKYDKDDNNSPMAGVTFGIYKVTDGVESKTAYEEFATDVNGQLTFNVLDLGKYVIKETRPIGYQQHDDIEITLTEADYNREDDIPVYNERKLGTLIIHKLNEDTDKALDGTQFALYKKNEGNVFQRIWWFITGNAYNKVETEPVSRTGETIINNIPWGSYYIVEEHAVDGYILTKTEYRFEVNATTVENNIELESTEENIIRNYKNSFAFKKQSTDATPIDIPGGKYSLNRIENGSETEVETFELSDSIPVKDFTGVKAGDYIIRELEAPAGYRKNEDGVRFTITEEGQIVKTATQTEWTDNTVILTDIPVAKFTVTKKFEGDSDWKTTIRPTGVKIQLYSSEADNSANKTPVGDPVTISVNTTDDEYSHEFTNLPMVNDAGKKLKYEAEEVELLYKDGDAEISVTPTDSIYTVDYGSVTGGDGKVSGAEYAQTITNTAPTGEEIIVKKVNHNGPQGKKFTFDVYAGKNEEHAVKINELTFELAANDLNTYNSTQLNSGEYKLKVPNAPYYEVKERLDEADPLKEYNVTYDWTDATKTYLTVTNDKIIYTMIENNTAEEEKEDHSPNPGGKIAIVKNENSNHTVQGNEERSEVEYKAGTYGVYWQAEDDGEWALPDSFTINYTESSGTEGKLWGSVTVEDYLIYDQDGKTVVGVKDKYNPCYENLKTRYEDFEIEYDSTGNRIVLYLSNVEDGLPYLNEVEIKFRPTIAVINTTDYYEGGKVKVENGEFRSNSDGKKENGNDDRYIQETVIYAEAEKGYCIDLSSIQVEEVGGVIRGIEGPRPGEGTNDTGEGGSTAKAVKQMLEDIYQPMISYAAGSPVSLGSDNTFTKTISYQVDDTAHDYVVSGKVEIEKRDAFTNPSKVKLVLSGLPVPIDVGIAFVESKDRRPNVSGGNAEDETLSEGSATNTQLTNKTSSVKPPKTGDTKELYLWIMILAAGICISMLGIFKAIQQLSLDNSKAGGQDEK